MNHEDPREVTCESDAIRVWLLDDLDSRLIRLQESAYECGVADGQKQSMIELGKYLPK